MKVDVVGVTVHTLWIDPSNPAWNWLNDYERDEWPEVLTEAANTTESQVEAALTSSTLDGAWRTAIVGEAVVRVTNMRTAES